MRSLSHFSRTYTPYVTRCVVLAVVGFAAVGCDGVTLHATGPSYITGSGSSSSPQSLIGRWSHIEPASADGGLVSRSGYVDQTLWQFDAGGTALRITRTLAADGTVLTSLNEAARWSADGTTLRLAFSAPRYAVRYVRYRIEVDAVRTTLYLDGAAFTRAGI